VLALENNNGLEIGVDEIEDFILIGKLLAFEQLIQHWALRELGKKHLGAS
jgi:hypothetical protein